MQTAYTAKAKKAIDIATVSYTHLAVVWKRQTSARTAVFPIRIWLFYKNTYWESHRLISERKNWESRNEEKNSNDDDGA